MDFYIALLGVIALFVMIAGIIVWVKRRSSHRSTGVAKKISLISMLIYVSMTTIYIATLPEDQTDVLGNPADLKATTVVETVTWDEYDPLDSSIIKSEGYKGKLVTVEGTVIMFQDSDNTLSTDKALLEVSYIKDESDLKLLDKVTGKGVYTGSDGYRVLPTVVAREIEVTYSIPEQYADTQQEKTRKPLRTKELRVSLMYDL